LVEAERMPDFVLKGFSKPVPAFNVVGLKKRDSSGENDGKPLASLTEREIDVLRLVAQGLTNAEIAARLVLSPLTVNAHLRSIYSKLDVTSRASATRFAVEHRLV
jgi:DNA-binding NarL/FixJ family response regulator